MGQLVGQISNIYRCNLAAIQTGGSKASTVLANGEVWLVDSTNSLTAGFSGNCDFYIMGDGTKSASALEVKPVDKGLSERVDVIEEEMSFLDIRTTTQNVSIIDYTPAGTAALTDTNFWANLGSLTTPDRERSGVLSSIAVTSAPSSDTTFTIRLYKKVWGSGVITGFTQVANSDHSFTMPANQSSLNVLSENIVIEPDVVIFISKLAKYNSLGTGYGAMNGALSPGFSAKFNLNVDYYIQYKDITSAVLNDMQGEINTIADNLDIQPVNIDRSIIDYTPSGTADLVGVYYWAALKSKSMPDRKSAGILKEIRFSSGYSSDTSFSIKLYRKIWSGNEISGFNEIAGSSHSYTMPANQLSLNVLSDNIVIDPDVLVFINGMAKYGNDGDCFAYYNGTYSTGFPGNFRFSADYIVQFEEDASVRLNEIEERLPKTSAFSELEDANVVCLGDSITWLGGDDCLGRETPSKGWTTYFMQMFKPKTMRSYARSGATWSHTANTVYDILEDTGVLSDNNVIYNQINRMIADVAQPAPDIIIIAAGTNDAWYGTQRPDALSVTAAQEFADTSGYITNQAVGTLTSIAAAMRYDIELLKTNYPNAQIFVTTPLQSTKFTLERCFDVGKVIKECAECLSVECIDQGKQAGIYRAQENVSFRFTYDGAHTSAIGAKMVGQYILKKVLCNYRDLITIT